MTSRFDNQFGGDGSVSELVASAAEWLVTLSDPDCNDDDRREFVAWLRRSNLHVEEFLRISQLTQELAGSRAWPRDSIADLIEKARSVDSDQVPRLATAGDPLIAPAEYNRARPPYPVQRWRGTRVALAASIVVGVLLVGVVTEMFDWGSKTYTTNVGEMRSITLEDGSVVELNTRSKLRARFTAAERDVSLLAGEAIFKVAKNPQRPFRVWSRQTEIVAVGTEFNVDAHNSRTVVTVLEGRVRVTNSMSTTTGTTSGGTSTAAQPIELGSGEQAVVSKHHAPQRVAVPDTIRVTAWTERRLIFEDTSLADVAAEFSRYNERAIRILGTALASKRITGTFNATDQASFVEFLRTHAGVRVREDTRGWELEARPTDADDSNTGGAFK